MTDTTQTESTITHTSSGVRWGYIDFHKLKELWFHTGTICNMKCPDCFEHSGPGIHRIEMPKLDDIKPFMDEAIKLEVDQFSFTGGEPFINPDIIEILKYGLKIAPCLVLTNGTEPLLSKFDKLIELQNYKHELTFRVSLDHPDKEKHDKNRGSGNFDKALDTIKKLQNAGFHVSVASRRNTNPITKPYEMAFKEIFDSHGIVGDVQVISFPDLENEEVSEISEDCMCKYHSPETYSKFMCAFSRMVVKKNSKMQIYSCTLVDDDPFYELGKDLTTSTDTRTLLKHPRCYACFAGGMSCSEL
ncbi:MAG: radical SAM protein [Candidatus Delongbacteria bacterium]|nr:radical SAM protein [Candidatus Delongbacteria bacterium]